jgi:hypothetical protein
MVRVFYVKAQHQATCAALTSVPLSAYAGMERSIHAP